MNRLKHLVAIVFTTVLLPLMDMTSTFCFGNTMKKVLLADMEKFFASRADAIIAEADRNRSIVKLCFSVQSPNETLDEIESTTLSVKIANALADFKYAEHTVIKSKTGDGYAHTIILHVIIEKP